MHINHKKIIWDSIFIITGCVLLAVSMIKEIDKNAFVIINNVHEVLGEGFKAIEVGCIDKP